MTGDLLGRPEGRPRFHLFATGDPLLNAHISPSLVLAPFVRIGIFVGLEPEPEPIDIALLGGHSVQGLLKNMLAGGNIDQIDRFVLLSQGGVDFPFVEH